ncbi:MAG TPA: peptide-methionine (S)-S-oxide reductase, partial [Acidimicrobiales bacterium]|nr:peptide-methionine (S)-S-oxide reductase [Acidimicrobiales bacterium]
SGIYVFAPEQRAAAEASRDRFEPVLKSAHYGPITTEILDAPTFYYAEDYHQQYLAKNPGGYCGIGGTGMSCPIGVAATE